MSLKTYVHFPPALNPVIRVTCANSICTAISGSEIFSAFTLPNFFHTIFSSPRTEPYVLVPHLDPDLGWLVDGCQYSILCHMAFKEIGMGWLDAKEPPLNHT